jgi:uncharacterized protein (DUF1015 family)
MIEVRGLRGLRFDTDVVGPLDNVITPPFDVISPVQRAQLTAQSPYNMAHILLPQSVDGLDQYEVAARLLDSWMSQGILRQDKEESLYLLEQTFHGLDGSTLKRRGFIGLTKLPEPTDDDILDHERTFDTKVADRMRLTEATRANLGVVFVLYADPEKVLAPFLAQMDARPPDDTATTIDGVTQRIWRVPYDTRVNDLLRKRKLYIADGHHRFRTAREYRDRMHLEHARRYGPPTGPRPYDYVLMGFVEFDDPGLRVWPTHRLVDPPENFNLDTSLTRLTKWFEVKKAAGNFRELVENGPGCTLGMAVHGAGQYVLALRDRDGLLGDNHSEVWRTLDVVVLHSGILEPILGLPRDAELVYEPLFDAALALVESGEKGMAFFVKATPTRQIVACADAHDPMPEKATYFFPKLPSGAVIHRLI